MNREILGFERHFRKSRRWPCVEVKFGGQAQKCKSLHKYLGVIFEDKSWSAYHQVRKVIVETSGGSKKSSCQTLWGVNPAASWSGRCCMAWSNSDRKINIGEIAWAVIISTNRGHKRTSTQASEVYCNTGSLQDRREFIVSNFFNRVQRLESCCRCFNLRSWISAGSRY